jgi:hypothetical protein
MKTSIDFTGILVFALFFTCPQGSYSQQVTANNWPREIESNEGIITIYQPEIESLNNNRMESRSAVSVTTKDNPAPVFGAMWFDCRISTDLDERTVALLDLKVVAENFPDVEEPRIEAIKSFVEKEVPKWEMVMSLDEVLTSMDQDDPRSGESEDFNNEAPEIIFKTAPTALVLIDGDPIFERINKTNYDNVVNTPFFIVKDSKTDKFFLKGGNSWYISNNLYKDWEITGNVPPGLEDLAEQTMGTTENETEDFADNEDNMPPAEIIVKTNPAELLLANGKPEFSPVQNTSLLYMTNTDDDILMYINTQEYFANISGRWYKTKNLASNQWTFIAPDELPEDFANIPEESPVSNVRANVYGTQEAKEAVLETQIPQTAQIDRNLATVDVNYDGDAEFDQIEGTEMFYAINTDKSVLRIEGRYYCCDNAVWFEGASPRGPWKVSIEIPRAIQQIPPRYPVYNVKYVYIYDYTPTMVYVGYTPGYVHSYVYHGCVYYGTGYRYRPWYRTYYYSRPVTYGFSVHYNPYSGWGFSYGTIHHGHSWVRYGYHYHHDYHGYWGPSGYRHIYRHEQYYAHSQGGYKRGYYQGTRRVSPARSTTKRTRSTASNNVYVNRRNGVAHTGISTYNPQTGQRVSASRTTTRQQPRPTSRSNDLYTDRSGNVYRRSTTGNWEQHSNGKWQAQRTNTGTARNTTTTRQQSTTSRNNQAITTRTTRRTTNSNQQGRSLNNQYDSRNRSNQRIQNYNQDRQQHQHSQYNINTSRSQVSPGNSRSSGKSGKSSSGNRQSGSNTRRR